MILMIDNYDSFVHNLARYFRLEGVETKIVRNDAVSAEMAVSLRPSAVVLSPGPKGPKDAGVSLSLLSMLSPATPVLGVCLGHQCLVEAFGGRTVKAQEPMHGRSSFLEHNGVDLFEGLPSRMPVGRYHSLVSVLGRNSEFKICARSEKGEIMAVKRQSYPWFGVQFHPESVLTPDGRKVIQNFMRYVR